MGNNNAGTPRMGSCLAEITRCSIQAFPGNLRTAGPAGPRAHHHQNEVITVTTLAQRVNVGLKKGRKACL